MDEPTLSSTPPARLRHRHAEHFLSQYRLHCGPPVDAYWLMVGYFDAYLFALATVWDMSQVNVRSELEAIGGFRFFKALRNVAAHHSILAAAVSGNKFERPFSREINVSAGGPQNDSSRLFFRLDVLRQIFDAVEAERPHEKRNIDVARSYISELESRGVRVYLEDIMEDALQAVERVLPHA